MPRYADAMNRLIDRIHDLNSRSRRLEAAAASAGGLYVPADGGSYLTFGDYVASLVGGGAETWTLTAWHHTPGQPIDERRWLQFGEIATVDGHILKRQ